jgi:hypothetical protein
VDEEERRTRRQRTEEGPRAARAEGGGGARPRPRGKGDRWNGRRGVCDARLVCGLCGSDGGANQSGKWLAGAGVVFSFCFSYIHALLPVLVLLCDDASAVSGRPSAVGRRNHQPPPVSESRVSATPTPPTPPPRRGAAHCALRAGGAGGRRSLQRSRAERGGAVHHTGQRQIRTWQRGGQRAAACGLRLTRGSPR